jgi:hypothetical protein
MRLAPSPRRLDAARERARADRATAAIEPPPDRGPDRIVVDHILIGVKSPSFPDGKRNAADAKTLAYALLAKLQAGADWATAKREHSEDPPPGGPYAMANRGVRPAGRGEYPRDGMVPAFGDVGFALAVGAIGLADHDARTSPFGFHLIRRVS